MLCWLQGSRPLDVPPICLTSVQTELLVGEKWGLRCLRCHTTRIRSLEREGEAKREVKKMLEKEKCLSVSKYVYKRCRKLTTFKARLCCCECKEGREML